MTHPGVSSPAPVRCRLQACREGSSCQRPANGFGGRQLRVSTHFIVPSSVVLPDLQLRLGVSQTEVPSDRLQRADLQTAARWEGSICLLRGGRGVGGPSCCHATRTSPPGPGGVPGPAVCECRLRGLLKFLCCKWCRVCLSPARSPPSCHWPSAV